MRFHGRGGRLAIETHKGDATTGKANGRGAARKVMKPAGVRIRMYEGNGLADPPGAQLPVELLGKSRHAIPAIGWVHKDPAMPFPAETIVRPRKVMLGFDSLLRNF